MGILKHDLAQSFRCTMTNVISPRFRSPNESVILLLCIFSLSIGRDYPRQECLNSLAVLGSLMQRVCILFGSLKMSLSIGSALHGSDLTALVIQWQNSSGAFHIFSPCKHLLQISLSLSQWNRRSRCWKGAQSNRSGLCPQTRDCSTLWCNYLCKLVSRSIPACIWKLESFVFPNLLWNHTVWDLSQYIIIEHTL